MVQRHICSFWTGFWLYIICVLRSIQYTTCQKIQTHDFTISIIIVFPPTFTHKLSSKLKEFHMKWMRMDFKVKALNWFLAEARHIVINVRPNLFTGISSICDLGKHNGGETIGVNHVKSINPRVCSSCISVHLHLERNWNDLGCHKRVGASASSSKYSGIRIIAWSWLW